MELLDNHLKLLELLNVIARKELFHRGNAAREFFLLATKPWSFKVGQLRCNESNLFPKVSERNHDRRMLKGFLWNECFEVRDVFRLREKAWSKP